MSKVASLNHEVIGSMNHIHRYDLRNFKGRIFFTTDLHGSYDLLHEKLKEVGFDSTRDILIVGGDNTDRGPDSCHVLDYLYEPWYISIAGNHEEIFIGAYEEGFNECKAYSGCLFDNGGDWARTLMPAHAKAIYEAFKELPLAIEILLPNEKVGIIHAECPYGDWDAFSKITKAELDWDGLNTAQWARDKYDKQDTTHIKGVDRLYVGHTPTKSGEVEVLGNVHYCDLGSFFRDKISFVEIYNGSN